MSKEQNYLEVELTDDEYEEKLNDIYGVVQICGQTFESGRALRELDPTAFRCGLSDELIQYECLSCGNRYEDEDEADRCCPIED